MKTINQITRYFIFVAAIFFFLNPSAYAFFDDFAVDSRSDYPVTHTWTKGGTGQLLYDAAGERLQVLTGDDVAMRFDGTLPGLSESGVIELDFLPTTKYPNGGQLTVQLWQDADNYYKIHNTDGYGAGTISKVVNGQVVDSASFNSEFSQATAYHLTLLFAPGNFTVTAFGQTLTLDTDSTGINVGMFGVELAQQDAYFDNFSFNSEIPNLEPTAVAGANQSVSAADNVLLDGSGSTDPDGTIVSYQWQQTGGQPVSFSPTLSQPEFVAPTVVSTEVLSFLLTVTDNDGATATDSVTVTVFAPGASAFLDDFSTDSRADYPVTHTWTKGGTGQLLYDAAGERLQVLTGDDVAMRFDGTLPGLSESGVIELDFLPTTKYPNGGQLTVQLWQDADNYYKIHNTDGYGAGTISKVVNGQVVDSASFNSEFSQATAYHLTLLFAPGNFTVTAFGQTLTLDTDSTGINVGMFGVELAQQDAYFDNFSFNSEIPNLEPTAAAGANQSVSAADNVLLDGSGSTDPDGTIVSYQWQQTGGQPVSFSPTLSQPEFVAPTVVSTEVLSFLLTVTDNDGATATDSVTVTVFAPGASAFLDDFSTDSRADYPVTHTWTKGGTGQLLYDAAGERLQVLTGDDVAMRFDGTLPGLSESGVIELDFLPTTKYPNGGQLTVQLWQDADNYYKIHNTDGYGAGTISKVVNGQVVDSASFNSEFSQATAYHLTLLFAPGNFTVTAFGQTLTLDTDSTGINVGMFGVELAQQDAYFDNFSFNSEIPNLEPTAAAGANQSVSAADNVLLDGSGSTDPDGTIVSYQWQQTGGQPVSFSPTLSQPEFVAPTVVSTEVLSFLLTVTDNDGATATDSVTVTVFAPGASAFLDDFSTDSRADYPVTHTWTKGGTGQLLYDAAGERLQVLTGDDVAMRFDGTLPGLSESGVIELDFLPTTKYPNGGQLTVQLWQDADNYYKIHNTDGYGAGTISKVVNGQVVDSASFNSEFSQATAYHLTLLFAPGNFTVTAFGQTLTLDTDSTGINVGMFGVELAQQDAYFDNFSFNSEIPNLEPTAAAGANQSVSAADNVLLDGSGSTDPDGTIVSYQWQQTGGQPVSFSPTLSQPEFVAPTVVSTEVLSFLLTVTDNDGATATDSVTVTVFAPGASAFLDDFSTDSRADYPVTHTWTKGGTGQLLYDAAGERLQVLTGDDVAMRFDGTLPGLSESGVIELDFLPTTKYPNGGQLTVQLWQDADNYYKIHNTDGYGAGTISKVVNGQVVDSASFNSEFSQATAYHLTLLFAPGNFTVTAFGQTLTLDTDSTGINVGMFGVELAQQDAYFDNFSFNSEIPNLEPTAAAGANQSVSAADNVLLDGSGSTDPDGTIVSYQWQQTGGQPVSFSPTLSQPEFVAPTVVSTEVLSFLLTVTDNDGATATDSVTVTVFAPGASAFLDDFSTDSRADYPVTHTWTKGGTGQLLYDAAGERLQVLTGDDVAMRFDGTLPGLSESGVIELDFLPTTKYPNGGQLTVQLWQDADNYYKIHNTDGYGAGTISKVVNGQVVDSASFNSEFSQATAYHLTLLFAPGNFTVTAFGQTLTLDTDSTGINVGMFGVELAQQDAYFDNFSFNSEISSFNYNPVARFQSRIEHPLSVAFDASQSIDPDGNIVLYAWDFGDGESGEGQTVSHIYASPGTYPVTLSVTDDGGKAGSMLRDIANNSDYYVAIGDSITRGSHDDISSDGLGYEPILAELLDNSTGYQNTIINKGVSGDTSADGLTLLPTILAENPGARYYLVMFGSNDAFIPVPSGLGLNSGDPGYPGSFKDNMQKIISAIVNQGKTPYLAKAQFATGSYEGLTPHIQEYNEVVSELAIENGIVIEPPNFYCLFLMNSERLDDGIHPDGVGYQYMAQWWFDAINGINHGECNQ